MCWLFMKVCLFKIRDYFFEDKVFIFHCGNCFFILKTVIFDKKGCLFMLIIFLSKLINFIFKLSISKSVFICFKDFISKVFCESANLRRHFGILKLIFIFLRQFLFLDLWSIRLFLVSLLERKSNIFVMSLLVLKSNIFPF